MDMNLATVFIITIITAAGTSLYIHPSSLLDFLSDQSLEMQLPDQSIWLSLILVIPALQRKLTKSYLYAYPFLRSHGNTGTHLSYHF